MHIDHERVPSIPRWLQLFRRHHAEIAEPHRGAIFFNAVVVNEAPKHEGVLTRIDFLFGYDVWREKKALYVKRLNLHLVRVHIDFQYSYISSAAHKTPFCRIVLQHLRLSRPGIYPDHWTRLPVRRA